MIYLASRALAWATLAVTTIFTHVSVAGEIDRWDSRWFIRAAEFGWPSQLPHRNGHVAANTIAFLPAFPLSFRWLSHLTGLSLLAAGVIVTSVSGLTAMIGVWMLIRAYADRDAADRGTLLVAMFPGSFVLSMVYSEGLVITFVAFGILALMRRRWLLAGLLGMLATATTPIALAFEVSCLWCAYREVARNRNWRSLLIAPVLTPLGFIGLPGLALGPHRQLSRHGGSPSVGAGRATRRSPTPPVRSACSSATRSPPTRRTTCCSSGPCSR